VTERLALLLKRTDFRELDVIVTLFTAQYGKVQALARGARRSRKRFGGALEPIHTLDVELHEPKRGDFFDLSLASVAQPRLTLPQSLERLQIAGKLLSWLRKALPERSPEPDIWRLTNSFLDRLDGAGDADPTLALGEFGLQLLKLLGWGITFDVCVRCGRICPPNKSGHVTAAAGGLICKTCGGGKTLLSADQRQRFDQCANGDSALLRADAKLALALVEEALANHADMT
jgi:DNA repair protein RecO (recombination protein O)